MKKVAFLLYLLLIPLKGGAHPISISEAVFDVSKTKVVAEIKIFQEDLLLFYPAMDDGSRLLSRSAIEMNKVSHKDFMAKYIYLLDETGDRIHGKTTKVSHPPIPKEGIRFQDLMKHEMVFTMEFNLPKHPKYLTFFQMFGGGRGGVPAQMLVTVLQEGKGTTRPFELTNGGNSETIAFSWPYEANAPKRVVNKMATAIEITNEQATMDVTIPFLTVESFLSIPRQGDDYIRQEEWHQNLPQVMQWLEKALIITAEGREFASKVESVELVNLWGKRQANNNTRLPL